MKKRLLSLALSLVMLLGLLPAGALALEEPAHSHDGWAAVTMDTEDTSKINVDGAAAETNTLPAGNYYLGGDITVPLTISEGAVSLCLNGHSVTVGNNDAVTVRSGASLTLWDCAAESAGKIAYTGTGTSCYGIYNQGTLTLRSGAVEGRRYGVTNDSASTFTMTGGSVTATDASGRGVDNKAPTSVFRLSGGSVSGGEYGIYNSAFGSRVYLSGAPSISGTEADIFTNADSSYIYADDGAGEDAVPYSGAPITLAYSTHTSGETAVYHVTEATKDKFTLTGLISNNYELKFTEADKTLQIMGKPQALTWYGIDGEALTGDGYPASHPYSTALKADQLPTPPTVEGKLFLGWLYQRGNDSDWSARYWSGDYSIYSATAFKADYIDSFTGGGSGAADDPYRLATAADLQRLSDVILRRSAVCNNSGVWYRLTEDIDLATVCGEELGGWMPIGRGEDTSESFEANFDGGGHTISNLYINTDRSYQGLFYSLDGATVKNLTLTGSVTAKGDLNALAGHIYDDTVVENVDVTGVTLTPYGYTPDGNRIMAYKVDDNNTIHIQGNYKNNWVQTTYGREGYQVATTDNLKGAVAASADFVNGGRYVQFSYTVTAGETAIAGGKLAVHADVQIGDNDNAAVETVRDADGQVIGLKMVDTHTAADKPDCTSRDAQFNLYFDGTGGVTPVDTYWFGWYGDRDRRNDAYEYLYFAPLNESTESSSGTYEQADGVYTRFSNEDSGFAISWQNIDLAPGESRTYSFILSVGEKAEPPQWSDASAVTLTLAAEATQERRLVNVSARVKDAAGLTDTLYYSVDGGEGEILGEVAADGSVKAITGQLDLSGYANGVYTFSFWVVNSKGAASASVEREITITADGVRGLDDGPAHEHAWAAAWTTSATHHWHECTAQGCAVTDHAQKSGYAAHAWDEGVVTKAPTADAEGVKTYTCTVCQAAKTETVPKPGVPTYTISGAVTDHSGGKLENVTVRLMRGSTQIAAATTDSEGNYSFANIPAGLYNVAAGYDGVTKTILVELTVASATQQNIRMPEGKTNSVVEVKGQNTPAAVAGGVDAVAEAETVAPGQSVTVKLTVEAKETPTDKGELDQVISGEKDDVLYLDLSLLKTIDDGENAPTATPISDTRDKVLEIVVPYDFTGKEDVAVYRKHGSTPAGKLAELTEKPTENFTDGSFYANGADGKVYIYASKFSTYAIAYTAQAETPSRSASTTYYTLVAKAGQGGSISPRGRISVRRGGTKTFAVTPNEGYLIADVLVDGKSVGAVTEYTFEKTTANHTIEAGFKKAEARPAWDPFEDVKTENWFHDGVKYVYEQGLMVGVDSTHFAPGLNTSRAMIATMIWRLAGSPETEAELNYPDCLAGSWYAQAVAWGAKAGVVQGYDNGNFGPDDPITREQMAVMLWRYAGQPTADGTLDAFTDADQAGSWAADALCWAVEWDILQGRGGGVLDPTGQATRAEAAAMLARYLKSEK